MTLQSNALNYASATRGDVDPRTGLYGFTLQLPKLQPNSGQGPDVPVDLGSSGLRTANVGFGISWDFKLSRYDLNNHVLSVHTGESFEVADQGPGEMAILHEQMFAGFTFKNTGTRDKPQFRIDHTNGLVEILEPLKADGNTFLPTRFETRSGIGMTLAYDDKQGRLLSITDDEKRQLLTVDFQGNHQVHLHVHKGTEKHKQFTLALDGDELRTLSMPVDDLFDWSFQYKAVGDMRFLERLSQPCGGVEYIRYKDTGHRYPGLDQYLPYVIEHRKLPDPRDETSAIKTTYAYSDTNFLGYDAPGVVWDENYNQDQLYKCTSDQYNYYTTVSHYLDGKVSHTVKHTFNRFHLMTEQVRDQAGCLQTTTMKYHDRPGSFASQDVRVQLPSKMTTTWTQTGTPNYRDVCIDTVYDTAGNLVSERLVNGMRMEREFYPAVGAEGCPPDPNGFKRNLKSVTVYPAEGAAEPGKILRTRYTYRALPVLSTSRARQQEKVWLVTDSVEEFEVVDEHETLLRREELFYLNRPDDVFLHGRLDYKITKLGKTQSRTEFHYEKSEDDSGQLTCVRTKATFKPHGGTLERTTTTLFDTLRGEFIEVQDANGVKTRYAYDPVNRPLAESVVDPEYPAKRSYRYGRVTENQRTLWYAEAKDVNDVITRTYHDGLNRPVREERTLRKLDDPESETWITCKGKETTYDTLGRVASETEHEYLPAAPGSDSDDEQVIKLTSHFSYDAWGQRCQVLQPDGVKLVTRFSPFGADGNIIEQWQERPDQPGIKQQHSVAEYNRFDKPVHEYRLHLPADAEEGAKPVEVDRTEYLYDGLGQAVKETRRFAPEHNLEPRITEFKYDHWARLFETVRPDGSVLTRIFDKRSTAELTTRLEVRDLSGAPARPACIRTFDGLERLSTLKVGPRLETYQYKGQTDLMESRTIINTDPARNDKRKYVERYEYKPALTVQPTKVTATVEDAPEPLAANEAEFAFRPTSAEVVRADNPNGGRAYTYTDQGYLAREYWHGTDAQQYDIHNQHSLQGRLCYRKHSDGVACQYGYDTLGRLATVTQGHLQAVLTYNSLGQLETTTTCDTRAPETRFVRTTQTYDDLGREHRRTLQTPDQQRMLVLKWLDGTTLQSRTLYNGDDKDEAAFLSRELFGYDDLDRLVTHQYEGDWDNKDPNGERWKALPRNRKGRSICSQTFSFDALDNLDRCLTRFADGNRDTARFKYATDDSFQLTEVTHTLLEDYPARQAFTYDTRGNMLNDERGHTLQYDVRGRLERVLDDKGSEQVRYLYDGHDQLLASVHGGTRVVQRRYEGHRLDATKEGDLLTQYLLDGSHALAVQRSDAPDEPLLLLTDNAGSIVTEADQQGSRNASYSAYGVRPEDNGMHCLLAFNGEVREEALGGYMLGSYRVKNDELMCFQSPDSLAPEEAGVNPYRYALGNPVRWRDPTGHKVSPVNGDAPPDRDEGLTLTKGIFLIVFGALLLVALILAPWSAPVSAGAGLAWAGLGLQTVGFSMQVAGIVLEKKDPKLSNILSFTGIGISIIGVGLSATGYIKGPKKPFSPTSGMRERGISELKKSLKIAPDKDGKMKYYLSKADNQRIASFFPPQQPPQTSSTLNQLPSTSRNMSTTTQSLSNKNNETYQSNGTSSNDSPIARNNIMTTSSNGENNIINREGSNNSVRQSIKSYYN